MKRRFSDVPWRGRFQVRATLDGGMYPDFAWQLEALNRIADPSPANRAGLDGILLTHAHIGHYAGLMLLGREALGADWVPVYAMPRMSEFLRETDLGVSLFRWRTFACKASTRMKPPL